MDPARSPVDRITYEDARLLGDLLGRSPAIVSEQTCHDLELPQVCARLMPGASLFALLAMLSQLLCVRDSVLPLDPQHAGGPLGSSKGIFKRLLQIDLTLVLRGLPERVHPLAEALLSRMPWLQVALLVLAPVLPMARALFILLALVNLVAAIAYKSRMEASCHRDLLRLNGAWRMLGRRDSRGASGHQSASGAMGSRLNLLTDNLARLDPTGLLEYGLIVLGLDVKNFLLSNAQLRDERARIAVMIHELGCYECACRSVVRQELSMGVLRPGDEIKVTGLRHPLIDECQPLSFASAQRVLLLHGDNMSGKSSLLRALGLDLIFRQGLGHGMSQSLTLPAARVESIINKVDDRARGDSLFFREVRRTQEALERLRGTGGILLLDEPFSGTHRSVRHALTRAILEEPAYRHVHVLLATHDDGLWIDGADHLFIQQVGEGSDARREVLRQSADHWDTEALLRRVGMLESVIERFHETMSNPGDRAAQA